VIGRSGVPAGTGPGGMGRGGRRASWRSVLRPRLGRRRPERPYRLLFADNPRPMWVYDLETLAFLDVNDAAVERYGYTRSEFLAMTIADIRPGEDIDALRLSVRTDATMDRSGPWRHRVKDGTLIEVEVTSHVTDFYGRAARFVMADDITARRTHEAELRRRALYDELTGLPNRVLVLDRLDRAIAAGDGVPTVVAVLVIDLDRFKLVNSAHGHALGDRLLKLIAMRLQEAVGTENSVGRLGSDEFAVVCEELSTDAAALAVAARVEAALGRPFDDRPEVRGGCRGRTVRQPAVVPEEAQDRARSRERQRHERCRRKNDELSPKRQRHSNRRVRLPETDRFREQCSAIFTNQRYEA